MKTITRNNSWYYWVKAADIVGSKNVIRRLSFFGDWRYVVSLITAAAAIDKYKFSWYWLASYWQSFDEINTAAVRNNNPLTFVRFPSCRGTAFRVCINYLHEVIFKRKCLFCNVTILFSFRPGRTAAYKEGISFLERSDLEVRIEQCLSFSFRFIKVVFIADL